MTDVTHLREPPSTTLVLFVAGAAFVSIIRALPVVTFAVVLIVIVVSFSFLFRCQLRKWEARRGRTVLRPQVASSGCVVSREFSQHNKKFAKFHLNKEFTPRDFLFSFTLNFLE